MKRFYSWPFVLFATLVMTALSGCSKDDEPNPNPDPDNGEVVGPNTNVDDPDGTIQLSMTLGSQSTRVATFLYLSSSGNLTVAEESTDGRYESRYYTSAIVSIGQCRGLGNVSTIPLTGWAQSVRAVKGNGYVYYDGYTQRYYRIFVESEITSTESVSGVYESTELLGYNIKYQHPFRGPDIDIVPEITAVTFDGEATGEQAVMFTNSSLLPFDLTVENGDGWLQVDKCTDKAESFLYNGVMLRVWDVNEGSEPRTAKVTISTDFGKSVDMMVTQSGRAPYISVEPYYQTDLIDGCNYFGRDGGTCNRLTFSSNLPLDKLSATTDLDWCKAEIIDNSARMARSNAAVRHVQGRDHYSPAPESRAGGNGVTSYTLQLTAPANSGEVREGFVTIKGHGAESADVRVYQEGLLFNLSDFSIELTPNENTFRLNTNIPADNLTIVSDADWCTVKSIAQQNSSVLVTCDVADNDSYDSRECHLSVSSDVSAKTAVITVTQPGKSLTISKSELWFDRNSGYEVLTVTSSSTIKAISSADWLTFSFNGSQMTIRVTAATEDRSANISFEGFDEKIIVHQSKYAVGDDYSENGVEGKVYMMNGETRLVARLMGYCAWSTENVSIGATDPYDGRKNWDVVTSIPNWKDIYPAFAAVDELNTNGVTGWYIPAKQERGIFIGGSHYSTYYRIWTSTEQDAYSASTFTTNGGQGSFGWQNMDKNVGNNINTYAVHRF